MERAYRTRRRPLLEFKTRERTAEPNPMVRGGTALLRRVVVLATVGALGVSVIPGNAAADDGVGSLVPLQGEAGSGPAPFPVEAPSSLSARAAAFRWSDLDRNDAWAKRAIDYVGKTNDWMRDFAPRADGTVPFRPDMVETRKYLARAVVRAFAPRAAVDPSITFTDLDPTQTFYRWANVAVQRGWMTRSADGRFQPDRGVTMGMVHSVLIDVLGMGDRKS